jgi:hypothetical protein
MLGVPVKSEVKKLQVVMTSDTSVEMVAMSRYGWSPTKLWMGPEDLGRIRLS